MNWLRTIVRNDFMYHVIIAAIIVAASYFLSLGARNLLRYLSKKIFEMVKSVRDEKVVDVVVVHVKPVMVVAGLHIAVREIRKGVSASDLTADQILDYGESILYIIAVLLVTKILLGIVRVFIYWYLERAAVDDTVNLKMTLGPLTSKVVNILVGLVVVIILLDHFGINIGSLLVSLGVGSLAVALAAQDTLANMIAGFVILVDRPFRVGDRIELSSGLVGDVQEIGLRSTKLLNVDANVIIIPNADLVKGRIINYAYPVSQMRVLLKIGVAYGTDPAKVREILLGLADAHPDLLKDPPPEVSCTAMNDSSVEFTLIGRASHFMKRAAAENGLREQAYVAFAKEGIEIPFPQRVVHMKAND